MNKYDYVREERSKTTATKHHCHWTGCDKVCSPAMWGCTQHWYQLPKPIRDRIWRAFRPGQEQSKTPSAEYIAVARDAQEWIAAHEAKKAQERLL